MTALVAGEGGKKPDVMEQPSGCVNETIQPVYLTDTAVACVCIHTVSSMPILK